MEEMLGIKEPEYATSEAEAMEQDKLRHDHENGLKFFFDAERNQINPITGDIVKTREQWEAEHGTITDDEKYVNSNITYNGYRKVEVDTDGDNDIDDAYYIDADGNQVNPITREIVRSKRDVALLGYLTYKDIVDNVAGVHTPKTITMQYDTRTDPVKYQDTYKPEQGEYVFGACEDMGDKILEYCYSPDEAYIYDKLAGVQVCKKEDAPNHLETLSRLNSDQRYAYTAAMEHMLKSDMAKTFVLFQYGAYIE